MISEEDLF